MTKEEMLARINEVKYWRHRIPIADGVVTPGSFPLNMFDGLGLTNEDLAGKSVLDIGAWDGYYSFACEAHGARRILATDVWRDAPFNKKWWDGIRKGDEAISCAKELLGSSVEHRNLDVCALAADDIGTFDVVLFLGVLYHLQHPLLALKKIHDVCGGLLVLETNVINLRGDERSFLRRGIRGLFRPAAVGDPLADLPLMRFRGEQGWYPNELCLVEMLKVAGFRRIEKVAPGPIAPSPHDSRYGRTIAATKLLLSLREDAPSMPLPRGEALIILGTELGNMRLEHPDAKWVRVERWQDGKIQGWLAKAAVEYADAMPATFDFKSRERIVPVNYRAYP